MVFQDNGNIQRLLHAIADMSVCKLLCKDCSYYFDYKRERNDFGTCGHFFQVPEVPYCVLSFLHDSNKQDSPVSENIKTITALL